MSAVKPLETPSASAVTCLDNRDSRALSALLLQDPIVNAPLIARLASVGLLSSARLGGRVFGVYPYAASSRVGAQLSGAVFAGANVMPIGGELSSWYALADDLAARPGLRASLVGRLDGVSRMWPVLTGSWGPARAIRANQPVLVTELVPHAVGDPGVRPAPVAGLDAYCDAATAMFVEELGLPPYAVEDTRAGLAYRARMAAMLRSGRALASFARDGSVRFKAEITAVTAQTAHVQGVWVRPDLRGRGLGRAGMTEVVRHALRLAPSVSLYVNDYNLPALSLYRGIGMRQVATMATVLL